MIRGYVIVCLALCLSGCTSFHVAKIDDDRPVAVTSPDPIGPLYVANKELSLEYQIFKQSGRFVESPTTNGATTIVLQKLSRRYRCGAQGAAFGCCLVGTLGLVPAPMDNTAIFSFRYDSALPITNHPPVFLGYNPKRFGANVFAYALDCYRLTSFWNLPLRWHYSERRAFAKALKSAPRLE